MRKLIVLFLFIGLMQIIFSEIVSLNKSKSFFLDNILKKSDDDTKIITFAEFKEKLEIIKNLKKDEFEKTESFLEKVDNMKKEACKDYVLIPANFNIRYDADNEKFNLEYSFDRDQNTENIEFKWEFSDAKDFKSKLANLFLLEKIEIAELNEENEENEEVVKTIPKFTLYEIIFTDKDNNILYSIYMPIEADNITSLTEKLAFIKNKETEFLYFNEKKLDLKYDFIDNFYEDRAAIEQNGKWGLINGSGEVIVEPIYSYIRHFCNGLAAVKKDEKWGFINGSGEVIVEPIYDFVDNFHEKLIMVEQDEKWGFINETGEVIVEPKYTEIRFFNKDLAAVKQDSKWGLINRSGEVIMEPNYKSIYMIDNNFIKIEKEEINNSNYTNEIVDESDIEVDESDIENEANVKEKGISKYGIVNTNGEIIIDPKYDYVSDFVDGVAIINIGGEIPDDYGPMIPPIYGGKTGCSDKEGNIIVEPKYDSFERIAENRFIVSINNKYGIIDKEGNEVVKLKYDMIQEFINGLGVINVGGAISDNESFIASEFCGGKYGIIDENGTEIIKPKYDSIKIIAKECFIVGINNKYGIIDTKGMEIIKTKYDSIESFSEGQLKVSINNKYGIIDTKGMEIIKTKYDSIESLL